MKQAEKFLQINEIVYKKRKVPSTTFPFFIRKENKYHHLHNLLRGGKNLYDCTCKEIMKIFHFASMFVDTYPNIY